jgi:DNA-binding CsgD family transcriptional regulator
MREKRPVGREGILMSRAIPSMVLILGDHLLFLDSNHRRESPLRFYDNMNEKEHSTEAIDPKVLLVSVAALSQDSWKEIRKNIRKIPKARTAIHKEESADLLLARDGMAPSAAYRVITSLLVNGKPANSTSVLSDAGSPRSKSAVSYAPTVSLDSPLNPFSQEPTPRELEILGLLADGTPMKKIAYQLGITYRTVTFHKYRLMRRLSIRTNAALLRYAIKRGVSDGAKSASQAQEESATELAVA